MLRIRVIRIKKFVTYIIAVILILGIVFFTRGCLTRGAIPAFSSIQPKNQEIYIQGIDDNVLKRLISLGLPVLDSFNKEKTTFINFRGATGSVFRLLTNVDIYNPETYFSMHIPLISMMKTEMALTPGIEPLPENTDLIENEPLENPIQPEPSEMENPVTEKIEQLSGQPLVLIYHTHTTEAYMPSQQYNYKPDKSYHTKDLDYSVVKVGEAVSAELNRLKIPTIHNKTVHDIPTYMTSYTNSLKTVEKVLKENPSIKIVIDLHRDAPIIEPEKSREITTVKIDGVTYSRLMFVIGTDKTFSHPNWKENHKFAVLLSERLEQAYPGISRGIDQRSERFNQHLSKNAILLEIGSHGNTMEESLNSAKIFAEILKNVIGELSITE